MTQQGPILKKIILDLAGITAELSKYVIEEISCFWNKEYGVLAVLIDGQLLGKMRLDELSVAPISGTLQFGQGLSGEQGMDMVLQEVRVYSF